MKALLIKPDEKSVAQIEVGSASEIARLIGYETVIADAIDENGDQLHFDEECFLRGAEGRFQLDKLVPVAGVGVITGSNEDGTLADLRASSAELEARIRFL